MRHLMNPQTQKQLRLRQLHHRPTGRLQLRRKVNRDLLPKIRHRKIRNHYQQPARPSP